MRKTVSSLLVLGSQMLIVGLFFTTVFSNNVNVSKHVSTVHNDNLNKIATSVSLLFEEDSLAKVEDKVVSMTIEELPSIAKVSEDASKIEEEVKVEEPISTPLYSIDASKYISNEAMGFVVTEDNKHYNLEGYEFDVVVAVVAGEFDKNLNDALGVVSVILNRCDSTKWRGSTPYEQVVAKNQFEVYYGGSYMKYMPGYSQYGSSKYEVAKQAVLDGLNGIRNNSYLGFRASWVSSYSDKYIVTGGNRYGYN